MAARCVDCGGWVWTAEGTCVECRAFPSLGYEVAALIQSSCAIPDGEHAGEPFVLTDEQLRFLLWHYRLDPETGKFVYFRGSQLVRPQKWGKGPLAAALICAEAHPEGPVLFAGWDAAGEPVGKPWPTPHVQVTAVSEDQVENVWRALTPMIELGALAADIPDTGKTRINLSSGGLIEPVTASAVSRLGQRVTFVVQDQTESWTVQNRGRALADNQRRGLAGMGGRWLETPNAWDPAEKSVAQNTSEDDEPGVHLDDVEPGSGSVRNKADRRRMLRRVYGDSHWVDLDRIDGEIVALLKRDAAQAERWFLNRKQAGESVAFDPEVIAAQARPGQLPAAGELVTIGIDGARFVDGLGIVATSVTTGLQWPVGIWERPADAAADYEHPWNEVDGALREAFESWYVWRVYVDEQYIEDWVDLWRGRWGEKRIVKWLTNRPRQAGWAVRAYTTAIGAGDWTHNAHPDLERHLRNARRAKLPVLDERGVQMHTLAKESRDSPLKMDGAWAGCLAWEARGDAIAAGARKPARAAAFL